MKTIYASLILFISYISYSNTLPVRNDFCNTINNSEITPTTASSKNISGLKIITGESKKLGKYLFIVSDLYTKKKVSFFNKKAEKKYTTKTLGKPIYLSKLKKGTYNIKIVEQNKVDFIRFDIN